MNHFLILHILDKDYRVVNCLINKYEKGKSCNFKFSKRKVMVLCAEKIARNERFMVGKCWREEACYETHRITYDLPC